MYIFGYKTTVFIQNLYILVYTSFLGTILLVFRDQNICGYKTISFIQNLYILVKFFGKNFIFRVKSTIFLVFQDQMYIFGYKTTVFIQNLYILVKFFGKNFIFRVKSQFFWFSGPNVHFWVQNCPKFVSTKTSFFVKRFFRTKWDQNLYIWQKLHF